MELKMAAIFDTEEDEREDIEDYVEMVGDFLEDKDMTVETSLKEDDDGEDTKTFDELLDELPSDEHRYVFRALQQNERHSRRIIHREVCRLDNSPFDDFDPETETAERSDVGDVLWDLERLGYVEHKGNLWETDASQYTNSALDF